MASRICGASGWKVVKRDLGKGCVFRGEEGDGVGIVDFETEDGDESEAGACAFFFFLWGGRGVKVRSASRCRAWIGCWLIWAV